MLKNFLAMNIITNLLLGWNVMETKQILIQKYNKVQNFNHICLIIVIVGIMT